MILIILARYMRYSGQLFFISVIMYSIHRFLIDFLRFYEPDERMGSLATSQVMSIIAATIAIAIMIFLAVWHARNPETSQELQADNGKKEK